MADYADDADFAPEAVSDEEKLTIATHMLMSSPPGQFWNVLSGERGISVTCPEGVFTIVVVMGTRHGK